MQLYGKPYKIFCTALIHGVGYDILSYKKAGFTNGAATVLKTNTTNLNVSIYIGLIAALLLDISGIFLQSVTTHNSIMLS